MLYQEHTHARRQASRRAGKVPEKRKTRLTESMSAVPQRQLRARHKKKKKRAPQKRGETGVRESSVTPAVPGKWACGEMERVQPQSSLREDAIETDQGGEGMAGLSKPQLLKAPHSFTRRPAGEAPTRPSQLP